MNLLHAGVDITVIALWLATKTRPPPASTSPDVALKEQAIARTTPPGRYQPPDRLLAFLSRLG